MKIAVFAPFGVYPARSAAHIAVLEPARRIAAMGHEVALITTGLRSFETLHFRSFQQDAGEGLIEHRVLSLFDLLARRLRGTGRLPPIHLSKLLEHKAPTPVRELLNQADAAIVESPWPFDFAKRHIQGPLLLINHNLEADLHESAILLHGGAKALLQAKEIEGRAWQQADLRFAYHEGERQQFDAVYGSPKGSTILSPPGVDTQTFHPASPEERVKAREKLGIPQDVHVILFTGSAHHPNTEALAYIHQELHPLSDEQSFFLIAGSVSPKALKSPRLFETGPILDMTPCFQAADCAINPMFSGSGMNQKVCQYLASGLPVLCSPFGARGFETGESKGILCFKNCKEFLDLLFPLQDNPEIREPLSHAARRYAEEKLSWERITQQRLTALLKLGAKPEQPGTPPGT